MISSDLKPDGRHKAYRVRWCEAGLLRQATCRSYEAAERLNAQKTLARGHAAPPVTQPNIRLTDYATPWLTELDVTPKTRKSYRELLSLYILPALGTLKVRAIHRDDIRRLLGRVTKRDGSALSKRGRDACAWDEPARRRPLGQPATRV